MENCDNCGARTENEPAVLCDVCMAEDGMAERDALRSRIEYLERRHAEMEQGWNACRALADSRQSVLEDALIDNQILKERVGELEKTIRAYGL